MEKGYPFWSSGPVVRNKSRIEYYIQFSAACQFSKGKIHKMA